MMVNDYDETRWMISLQTDHSKVAGYLAAHWGNQRFARLQPYSSMVLAAQEHDSGWTEWEMRPTISEQGLPHDYIGSIRSLADVWFDMYANGRDRVRTVDPYAALIIQMHGEALLTRGAGLLTYMPSFTDMPEAQEFIAKGEVWRNDAIAALQSDERFKQYVTDEALELNFRYMETFDQFAQYLCNRRRMDVAERTNGPTAELSGLDIPVRPGVPHTRLRITAIDEESAIVDPFPFDVDPFCVPFTARLLKKRTFTDQDDFVDAFLQAEHIVVTRRLLSKEAAAGASGFSSDADVARTA